MTPILYSLKKYLLDTYDVPGILLGARDIGNSSEQNKQSPCPQRAGMEGQVAINKQDIATWDHAGCYA